jgi:potassium-transporting ATPase KdpC subunit
MKKNLITAILMTVATTLLLGIIYPLIVTGLAQLLFPRQANGQLIEIDGRLRGSHLIGQAFSAPEYFHSRLSAAGNGYDPTNTNGSQLGPTNHQLIERVKNDAANLHAENPASPVPIDLVTASASGLDPDITPAAAEFQIPRVAKQRSLGEERVRDLVRQHTSLRQFGVLGEPRVNVLELNLALNEISQRASR